MQSSSILQYNYVYNYEDLMTFLLRFSYIFNEVCVLSIRAFFLFFNEIIGFLIYVEV